MLFDQNTSMALQRYQMLLSWCYLPPLSKFIIYVYYFFLVYVKKNVPLDECFIFGDSIIKIK